MKFEVIAQEKSEVLIKVSVETDELKTYEDRAVKSISENVDIKGYRKGQAPKLAVLTAVGPERFNDEVMRAALPMTYAKAVQEKNLQVVSRPSVKVITSNPLVYEARVAVLPTVDLGKLDNIKIPKENIEVSDEELSSLISQLLKYKATYEHVKREAKKGDRVEIDFQGFNSEKKPVEEMMGKSHQLTIGEGTLIPGFEDELEKMSEGDSKKFEITFPKDYKHKPSAGKKFEFEVSMKKVEEVKLPELTDEFILDVTQKKQTVEEFKVNIREDFKRQKEKEHKQARENKLLEELVKSAKLDVPPLLLEEEIEFLMQDLYAMLQEKGIDIAKYEEHVNKKGRDIRKEYNEEAEKRIRVRMVLNALFEELKIVAGDEEIAKSIADYMSTVPDEHKASEEKLMKNHKGRYIQLVNNIKLDKVFSKFLN